MITAADFNSPADATDKPVHINSIRIPGRVCKPTASTMLIPTPTTPAPVIVTEPVVTDEPVVTEPEAPVVTVVTTEPVVTEAPVVTDEPVVTEPEAPIVTKATQTTKTNSTKSGK